MKKKIKLRDLTAEQWDNYRYMCCVELCKNCPFEMIDCGLSNETLSWFNNKRILSDKFLNQEVEIEVLDILTKEEKEYLSAVIKPYRDKVIKIRKCINNFRTEEEETFYYIHISIRSKAGILLEEIINLPCFNNTMYKGMENYKEYTLKELGL